MSLDLDCESPNYTLVACAQGVVSISEATDIASLFDCVIIHYQETTANEREIELL